jgi:hypothetical protein
MTGVPLASVIKVPERSLTSVTRRILVVRALAVA